MTVHVLHLVTSFDTGGLQTGIVNLVNGSDPSRLRHTVLSMRRKLLSADRLAKGTVDSVDLPEGRVPLAYRAIATKIKAHAPDIVHTRNWGTYPDGVLAARRAGVRVRIHGHHGKDLQTANGEPWRRRLIGGLLGLFVTRFTTLTPSMARELGRDYFVPMRKISIIPNGVDLRRLEAYGADPDYRSPFTVVSVGRLDPVKNLPLLIRAFAGMRTRGPGDRLVIAGEGPERARLEALISDLCLGREVLLAGERRDAPAVIKAADVYVQPSFYEGMSNTIVEAMACGVPVVATDAGGNADVAGRDGTAVLVPSDDLPRLTAELDRLRASVDARRALGLAGQSFALGRYGLDRMIAAYTALYENAAPGAQDGR